MSEAKERIQAIIDNTNSIIYMKDMEGRYLLVNRRFLEIFEYQREEVIGKDDFELFPAEIALAFQENDRSAINSNSVWEEEEQAYYNGSYHTFFSSKFAVKNEFSHPYALCCISTDITQRKKIEDDLKLASMVFNNASEAIVITDPEQHIVDVNPAYTKLMGYSRDEIIGKSPSMVKSGHHDDEFYTNMWEIIYRSGSWSGEIWDRRKNGEVFPKWLNISAIKNSQGEVSHYLGIFSDVSEKKKAQEALELLAFYDPLTGLPNRVLYQDRLTQEILHCERSGKKLALLFIDLDRFKYINDTMGHPAGDELLVEIANRLKKILRKSDTIARMGGDEFTAIISDLENNNKASYVAKNIIESLEKEVKLRGEKVYISGSIGIAIFPDDAKDMETLTKNADTAMYKAKESGRGNYRYFRREMDERNLQRIQLENKLREAVLTNCFRVYYQPKIEIATGLLVGAEALLRWFNPDGSTIPNDEFIPIAEETMMIIKIGDWVMRTVCQEWQQVVKQNPELSVAVNLSATQFADPTLAEKITAILTEENFPISNFELELTESSLIENPERAINVLNGLQEKGFCISIDDFGTGYSSMGKLKKFPIQVLKIDRSFIMDLPDDLEDAAIVRAIISIARSLELDLIAEGVETEEQLAFLQKNGCNMAQGYLYSKPLPIDEFINYIKTNRASKIKLS